MVGAASGRYIEHMPEYPDVCVYVDRLDALFRTRVLESLDIINPFVLRTVDPPVAAVAGRELLAVRRIGKRIALAFPDDVWVVIHLMIAGRLRMHKGGKKVDRRRTLAVFSFGRDVLHFTEAGSKRRASIHLVRGKTGLAAHDPGGIEVFEADSAQFAAALRHENHTIKRSLTDPRIISGVGNTCSDEILHEAQLSPFVQTGKMTDRELERLFGATRAVLARMRETIAGEVGDGFPDKVTAFRDDLAVHGKYRRPCPRCGSPIQRIRYAENETNYCAACQTGGKLLADRALSRLLKDDWPRSLDELESLGR
ncbi:MAG: hypothetical protein MI724_10470 [Spirochaetales bacterium]|nr:hypothetical protein [Spirochaetales bacterium]